MGEDDIAAENLQEQGAKRRTQNTATSYPPAGTNIIQGEDGVKLNSSESERARKSRSRAEKISG